MAIKYVFPADPACKLPDGFKERKALYVSHGPPDLCDHNIFVVADPKYPVLYFIGNVGYHLNCGTVVSAASFPLDDRGIHFSGSTAVFSSYRLIDETLIMPKVKIGLSSVPRHKNFTMLEGAHCTCINIYVRIHLYYADAVTSPLEQNAERCGRDTLSQR